jgi:hypothetical protein
MERFFSAEGAFLKENALLTAIIYSRRMETGVMQEVPG